MDYIIVGLSVFLSLLYLIRRIRREIKMGQCGVCPLSSGCKRD
ncbi:MAG: FeoB-associated Cys-rich membrane protein [Aquificae bacterium]|nr:FeoB-associated Cys-rich membrane protein [Aquificota bacterium]